MAEYSLIYGHTMENFVRKITVSLWHMNYRLNRRMQIVTHSWETKIEFSSLFFTLEFYFVDFNRMRFDREIGIFFSVESKNRAEFFYMKVDQNQLEIIDVLIVLMCIEHRTQIIHYMYWNDNEEIGLPTWVRVCVRVFLSVCRNEEI